MDGKSATDQHARTRSEDRINIKDPKSHFKRGPDGRFQVHMVQMMVKTTLENGTMLKEVKDGAMTCMMTWKVI